ncbi:MAG: PAS domain S-box protein [Deltaproteobacteria bacterium]|nr:PAS domain S-box protein [Deltaproteobacteria bacterium]
MSEESKKISFESLAVVADLANMGLTISSFDEKGEPRVIFVNRRMQALLGRSADEMRASSVWTHIAEEELPRLLASREKRLRTEVAPFFTETVVRNRDGRRIPVEMFHNETTIEGRPVVISFTREITDRKAAEEELRRSERRFRTVVESAPYGVAILKGLQIAYLNSVAARLLGAREPSEVEGKSITDFLRPTDAQRVRERLSEIRDMSVAPKESSIYQSTYHSTDMEGRDRTVEVTAIPIEYQDEPAVLGFARDVTERIEIQNRIVQAEKLAALGTLAAGIAHEINNPLAYVLISLIRAKKKLAEIGDFDASEICRILDDAHEGVERISRIVRDVQRYTHPSDEERGKVSVREAMDHALSLVGHAIGHNTRVIRRYVDTPYIMGNIARIEQLFLNLVINATQALEGSGDREKQIEISIALAGEDVVVEVADSGCGMSRETIERIFSPFFTTKPTGKGTGLGLAICRSIVDDLGGEIRVSSELGQGSRFCVVLPVYDKNSSGAISSTIPNRNSIDAPPAIAAGVEGGPSIGKRARLLLVDDEPKVAEMLKAWLDVDFDVYIIPSGTEAIEAIKEGARFDVVLCDFRMPRMNGVEFLEKLRELDAKLAESAVMMTGMLDSEALQHFSIDYGCPVLQKPFHPEKARSILLQVMKKEQS